MRLYGWLTLSTLVLSALGCVRPLTESDVVGGWRVQQAQFGYSLEGQQHTEYLQEMEKKGSGQGWLVLWPDHVWLWGGPALGHGASRWRLVGDTLWLAGDWTGYYQGENGVDARAIALIAQGRGIGVIDQDVMRRVQPSRQAGPRSATKFPDSVFWSPAFRDTTRFCEAGGICTTWVYKVTRNKDRTLSLVRIEALTRQAPGGATVLRIKRDALSSDRCRRMVDTTGPLPSAFRTRREWLTGVTWGSMHDDSCH